VWRSSDTWTITSDASIQAERAELQQGSWGAYKEERLTLLAVLVGAQAAGDNDLVRQALKQLRGSYPHSPSAQVLADKLGPEREGPR
jgi:hypothetical protein